MKKEKSKRAKINIEFTKFVSCCYQCYKIQASTVIQYPISSHHYEKCYIYIHLLFIFYIMVINCLQFNFQFNWVHDDLCKFWEASHVDFEFWILSSLCWIFLPSSWSCQRIFCWPSNRQRQPHTAHSQLHSSRKRNHENLNQAPYWCEENIVNNLINSLNVQYCERRSVRYFTILNFWIDVQFIIREKFKKKQNIK